jgi:hypothetical protein
MPQKYEYVQLEPNEDVASVRDRLAFLRGQHVLLIWPESGTALQRKLDLVLIQREAMRLVIRVAFITHDPEVIRHAAELNISTFETIGASDRGKWKRGRSRVFTDRFGRPEDSPEPDELMEVATRVRPARRTTPLQVIGRIFLLLTLIAMTGLVAYLLIPSATVTITPAQTRISTDAAVQAVVDPDGGTRLDVENGIMSASIARTQIEEQASIPTTGRQELTDAHATGSVVFINRTNSAIRIPIGTLVSTSSGSPVTFRTTQEATVTAGRGLQIEVPVEAVENVAGDVGNVEAGLINMVVDTVLADQVEVRNLVATVGGQNRTISIVTQTDRDRLLDILRQQIQNTAYNEMLPRLDAPQFIIPETIHIAEERSDWMTFDFEVGDSAEILTLTMRAVVEATVVDESVAQQIAFTRLAGQIPNGHVIRPETLIYERGSVTSVQPGGGVTFTISCSGQIVTDLNTNEIQQNLAGKTVSEAAIYLGSAFDLAEGFAPEIHLAPEWVQRLPLLPLRITVRTQSPVT